MAKRLGKAKLVGKDVDHKDSNPRNNSPSNLRVSSIKKGIEQEMLNFILPILKNPLTRMIGSKVIDGINHKMEKDKIIRAKEIEAVKTVSVEWQDNKNTQLKMKY